MACWWNFHIAFRSTHLTANQIQPTLMIETASIMTYSYESDSYRKWILLIWQHFPHMHICDWGFLRDGDTKRFLNSYIYVYLYIDNGTVSELKSWPLYVLFCVTCNLTKQIHNLLAYLYSWKFYLLWLLITS